MKRMMLLASPRLVRKVLRAMSGDSTDPRMRALRRQERQAASQLQQERQIETWLDKIKRREQGASDLPPMPFHRQQNE